MDRIGVRELRQNASRYLARVAKGEVIEVTDRGKPIARLVPIAKDPIQELIDGGRLKQAEEPGSLLDVEPVDFGVSLSAILEQMRADER